MPASHHDLGQRIVELRRRHFGGRGKREFARRLCVEPAEYERFERGTVPSGEVLVRMCEVTGEDLQWLLTGVASRGTMVIAGARARHQGLIEDVARLLESSPESAGPLEAFVELLAAGPQGRPGPRRPKLNGPSERRLIPVLEEHELPDELTAAGASGLPVWLPVARPDQPLVTRAARLIEPNLRAEGGGPESAALLVRLDRDPTAREFVACDIVANAFADAFGVRVADRAMTPMLDVGDVAILAASAAGRIGRPVACKLNGESALRCRVWLDATNDEVTLGRLSDGGEETLRPDEIRWSLEVIYAVRAAA